MKRRTVSFLETEMSKVTDSILLLKRLGYAEAASLYEHLIISDPAVGAPQSAEEYCKALLVLFQVQASLVKMADEFESLRDLRPILASKVNRAAAVN